MPDTSKSDYDKFEEFAAKFSEFAWEDLGRDKIFFGGMEASRQAEGGEVVADGKGSLPWFVHVYNSGYQAGHHDTVEGGFMPVHHSDKDTYHEDEVLEILEDLNVQAHQESPLPKPESAGVPEALRSKVQDLCDAVINDDDLPPVKYALRCGRLINEVKELLSTTPQPDNCPTCNGHGMIGGPSYAQPDEGGEPCPDCNSAESDNWIRCSERLPTNADADALGNVWIFSQGLSVTTLNAEAFSAPAFYTYWKPTGLTRPQPPAHGGQGDE